MFSLFKKKKDVTPIEVIVEVDDKKWSFVFDKNTLDDLDTDYFIGTSLKVSACPVEVDA